PELREACYTVPEVRFEIFCPKGEARITPAFQLVVSHVIHTVGPIYDVDSYPEVTLRNAYRYIYIDTGKLNTSGYSMLCFNLLKANENGIEYIAFPAISCGAFE
ncbi:hypothetical protein MKW92_034353, partial [Papaver armeniacum]